MKGTNENTATSSQLEREAGTYTPTVKFYACLGLLDYIRLANGTRLYRVGQADRVCEIYNERIGNRGRR